MSQQVAEVLERALVLFGPNGEKWHGGKCPPDAEHSFFCIHTAISKVNDIPNVSTVYLVKTLGFERLHFAWKWNDAPRRTFAQIKRRFEKGINLARRGTE